MNAPWWFSSQRLMATFPVIFIHKRIVPLLLLLQIALRRHRFFQGPMHPLVPSVLRRFTRLDPLRFDAQLDPPFRELTDPTQSTRGEWHSVVSAHAFG